jgi:uncharacterized protein YjbJ (UPF0337 family)
MEKLTFKLDAPWSEVKEQMKEHNMDLTDQDLDYQPGKEDELLEGLQSKLGKSKAEIKALIESISYNKGMAG